MTYTNGLDFGLSGEITLKMKKLFKKVVTFTKREWFLFITIATITLIIVLFEFL